MVAVTMIQESYETLSSLWHDIVDNHSPETIEVVGSALIQILGFLAPAFSYQVFDLCFPQTSQASKLQEAKKQPPKHMIWRCVGLALFNHAMLISGHAVQAYFVFGAMFRIEKALPSAIEVFTHFVVATLFRDVLFYYVHRLLHMKFFYRHLHHVHHQFPAPIALAAVYSHPIDHMMQNAFPIAFPMIVLRSHFLTVVLFATVALLDAALAHSGYDFLRVPAKVSMHDLHHMTSKGGYGVLGLMDWIHGTSSPDVYPRDLDEKEREERVRRPTDEHRGQDWSGITVVCG